MDHFKAAERALREAEALYSEALQGPIEESKANTMQAEYKLLFADAHTALAAVQSRPINFTAKRVATFPFNNPENLETEELDPEPWAVYRNGMPTFQRKSVWTPPGDNGAGSYYTSIFDPRSGYSQSISNY